MMQSKHLRIRGRVQGVGFRYAMAEQAKRLALCGWVRNRADGTVEAVVSGASSDVEEMLGWAHEGPAGAQVASVDVSDVHGEFTEFDVLATL
jgi:acylphosphatase